MLSPLTITTSSLVVVFFFLDRARLLIVMEMMEGGELFHRISQHRHFTEKMASQVTKQVNEDTHALVCQESRLFLLLKCNSLDIKMFMSCLVCVFPFCVTTYLAVPSRIKQQMRQSNSETQGQKKATHTTSLNQVCLKAAFTHTHVEWSLSLMSLPPADQSSLGTLSLPKYCTSRPEAREPTLQR